MSKIFRIIKHPFNNSYSGEQFPLHIQYGYHHGFQCQYLEATLVSTDDGKYFKGYTQLFYMTGDAETILEETISKLKEYNIELDEIQLLTEADVAFEEIILDEETK
jgi:hypothetical protein